MNLTEEEKEEMKLSDKDADILKAAVELIRSKPIKERPGHLGAILFTSCDNPQVTMQMLIGFVKYTIDNFAKDDSKVDAAKEVVANFQEHVEVLQDLSKSA